MSNNVLYTGYIAFPLLTKYNEEFGDGFFTVLSEDSSKKGGSTGDDDGRMGARKKAKSDENIERLSSIG